MVIINFKILSGGKSRRRILRGWSREWVQGGLTGVSREFMLNEGIICRATVKKGFVAVKCLSAGDEGGSVTHILLKVSLENLCRFFSVSDAAQIIEAYCLFN